jgi:hypothetical protein
MLDAAAGSAKVIDRLQCCVPFCRHTRAKLPRDHIFSEWICGDHWRMVDKKYRRVYGRYVRQWRRSGPSEKQTEYDAANRLWHWLKRKAIERATGIA